jgi:hypothetical protein
MENECHMHYLICVKKFNFAPVLLSEQYLKYY